jgi:hypothetical protein
MPESRTPEQIEADIAAQRERLAQTVDQLSAKLDVKSRTRARLADMKDRATTVDGTPRPEVIAAAGSLVAMIAVLLIWRLRRQH